MEEELKGDFWSIIFKGVLNSQSTEARCFHKNMERVIRQKEALIERKLKRELIRKYQ